MSNNLIISSIIWGTVIFLIIYLILRRFNISKKETFEKREN